MTDATYVRLTEHNDWEGETWHFYLPVAGNEDELAALRALIADDDEDYMLSDVVFTEQQVDTLVSHGGGSTTYLSEHTKLAGRMRAVADLGSIYKGQIADHFTTAP